MSELPPDAREGSVWRLIERLRLAIAFLTILPVGSAKAAAPERIAESFGYFPLVGFMIGAAMAVEDRVLSPAFGPPLRSVLIVISLAVLTGAVHLDGLADTADALGAGRNRERALTIMRDSAIGSFGAIALFGVLGLKVAALAATGGARRYAALYLAPGLARWAMVAVSSGLGYLRAQGAGSGLLEARGAGNLAFATLIAALAAMLAPSGRMLGALCAAALASELIRAFYRRWLGGVTGDLIGAAGEIVEVMVLIVMSA